MIMILICPCSKNRDFLSDSLMAGCLWQTVSQWKQGVFGRRISYIERSSEMCVNHWGKKLHCLFLLPCVRTLGDMSS